MKKKLLIIYATYGSGHKTVATYIYDYFTKYGNYDIKMIDLVDYENIIGLVTKKMFETNTKNKTGSAIFSFAYEFFDHKITTLPYRTITKSILNNKRLRNDIVDFNPDLLISTHFFGNIILGLYNKKGLTNTKIMSIITDYKMHEMWIKDEKSIDALIVSNDIVKNELINHDINKNKIYAFGIPLAEKFTVLGSKEKIKEKYNITNDKMTVLFFAGGSSGSFVTYRYLKRILDKRYDVNIIFVCGKNEKLKEKVMDLVKKEKYNDVHVLGFSTEVNNLLNISDVVITKPGALSITECLEMKKPMILIPGAGGQEIYNAKFVCKNGYGLKCNNPRKLNKAVSKIIKYPSVLKKINKNLSKYLDNDSIKKIFKLSDKLLK